MCVEGIWVNQDSSNVKVLWPRWQSFIIREKISFLASWKKNVYHEHSWDFVVTTRKMSDLALHCLTIWYRYNGLVIFLWRFAVPVRLSLTRNTAERLSAENSHTLRCVCTIWTSKNPSVCRSEGAAGLNAPGGRVLQCTPPGLVCASPGALSALSERPSIPNQMLREPSRKAKPCDIRVTYRGKTLHDLI
jgi:hypothetical protein